MAYPLNGMTLFEAARVARMGVRIRREGEEDPTVWYHRHLALWYRQENEGPLELVENDQYTAADFTDAIWTTLGPDVPPVDPCPAGFHYDPITGTCVPDGDDPPEPPDPPDPPRPPEPPGPDDPPLPPLPPGPDDDGDGPGDDGDRPPVPPLPPDPPPFPPFPPVVDDDDEPYPPGRPKRRPEDPPEPPKQSPNIISASVACGSGSIDYSITGQPTPKGAAYSVTFVCELGHTHPCGVLYGSDTPQTVGGEADPHVCVGGSFVLKPLTQGGGAPPIGHPAEGP